MLADDAVVIVKGRLDKRDDQPKLIAMEVEVFERHHRRRPAGAHRGCPPPCSRRSSSSGSSALLVRAPRRLAGVPPPRAARCSACPTEFYVDAGTGFLGELRVLLGADCLL